MDAIEMFAKDPRIVKVRHYRDAFVPNAYRYRAPGEGVTYERPPEGQSIPEAAPFSYDRKRSFGKGPAWVGYSAKGGVLYTWG